MILAIALPQTPAVDLTFAFDLANLVGHLSTTYPLVSVRLLMAPDESVPLTQQDFVSAATEAGADLVVFLGERRFGATLFDRMLDAALTQVPKNDGIGIVRPEMDGN